MSLRVLTRLGPSPIHGTGLFAAQDIPQGTVVWDYDPSVDYLLHRPPIGRLADWAWREADAWVVPGDDARFINHAAAPNLLGGSSRFEPDIAGRDIAKGEELTIDYATFDLDWPTYAAQMR